MPRNYVDNAMNRSLGRVGMPVGSAVHSTSSGSSSSFSGRTYVDNSMNQSLGRVGLPLGSAVHSKGSCTHSPTPSPSSSGRTYADNSMNRSLGRVGLSLGSAVHSKGSSTHSPTPSASSRTTSTRTYMDNPMNRTWECVGLPVSSAVLSKNASAYHPISATPKKSTSTRTYVDNAMNRRLERVGLPIGTAVHSKNSSSSSSASASPRTDGKVYKDNDFNRKHNRVGLPLGSKSIRNNHVYEDNAINRHLNRVGLPMGTQKVSKSHLAKLRKFLCDQNHFQREQSLFVEEDSGFAESGSLLYPEFNMAVATGQSNDDLEHVMEGLNRDREEDLWMDQTGKSIRSSIQATETCSQLTSIQSKAIKLDDLNVNTKIGHGGFGEVYLAEYEGQVIAVKFLKQTNLTKKRLKLFENEIITHSQLDHPNIIRFYGPCLERQKLAIVMEYMDASLWECLHLNEVEFLPEHKLNIIHNVTSGLDYLHGIPLVHADLKTQNVLLINIPGTPAFVTHQPVVAKLSDFGLSLLKSDTETSQSTLTTQKNQPVGATYRYAAPEVIRGDLLNTSQMLKTDIYSMGLIIMELAVEEIPFEKLSIPQLMKHVGEKGTKPASPPNIKLDKNIEKMLHQCWSFDPLMRPSARKLKEMASKLSGILEE